MHVNKETFDLIKKWEGCKLKAYKCPAGVWTVGYGLTTSAGFIEVGPNTEITQDEADWYLEQAVLKFADKISPHISGPINDNQFGAFVSLAYNIGVGGFKKSSALRHFNSGDHGKVPASIRLWNKAGGKVLQGLVNRREDEVELFLKPVEVAIPEPEPQVEVKPEGRSNVAKSTTVQATVVQAASAVGAGVTAISALDGTAQLILIGCLTLVVISAMWIFKERIRKWRMGDR